MKLKKLMSLFLSAAMAGGTILSGNAAAVPGIAPQSIAANATNDAEALQMLVRQVTVHQNDDKSIDVRFEMNGNFNNGSIIEIESD